MTKRKTHHRNAIWVPILGLTSLALLVVALLIGTDVTLFNPRGFIADEQHRLMFMALAILVGFCVPVLGTLYFFAWKYREDNPKAVHDPHPNRSNRSIFIVWGIPLVILVILASFMIPATFRLEPRDTIASDKKPLTIQVVALRWKWLFIYPEQNIATVNYLQIPVDTPVQFDLTADEAPMNSFWIPHLGGQLYAMTGHENRLNLMGDTLGDYVGSAAEINGAGFAGMRFNTRVSTQADFDAWVGQTKQSVQPLSSTEYAQLLQPSENNAPAYYGSSDPQLFHTILDKYRDSHQHMDMQHEGYQ